MPIDRRAFLGTSAVAALELAHGDSVDATARAPEGKGEQQSVLTNLDVRSEIWRYGDRNHHPRKVNCHKDTKTQSGWKWRSAPMVVVPSDSPNGWTPCHCYSSAKTIFRHALSAFVSSWQVASTTVFRIIGRCLRRILRSRPKVHTHARERSRIAPAVSTLLELRPVLGRRSTLATLFVYFVLARLIDRERTHEIRSIAEGFS